MYSGDSQEFQLPNLVIQASPQPQPHVLLPCLGYLPAAGLMTLSYKVEGRRNLVHESSPHPNPQLSLCSARGKQMD